MERKRTDDEEEEELEVSEHAPTPATPGEDLTEISEEDD